MKPILRLICWLLGHKHQVAGDYSVCWRCGQVKETPRYIKGVEIYEGFARLHPHNCAVKERTGDGVPVGACQFYLPDGKTCPRHGKVKE